MILLVNSINGHIRHSGRLGQLHRVCQVLNITPMLPVPTIDKNNAWFAGFFDADGTVTLNISSVRPQLTISVTNKKNTDVLHYKHTFGGAIYYDSAQNGYYKWTVQSRVNILIMLNYFKVCPARSFKQSRLHLISRYYKLYDMEAFKSDSIHYHAWQKFVEQWNVKI